jgi:hypothetical protein
MGRSFPLAPGSAPRYPIETEALDPAECVLLISMRCWVADIHQEADPLLRLRPGLAAAGAPDAALSLDALMRVLARTARRPIAIGCPRCPGLSADERRLLHAASLAQAGAPGRAEAALRADGMLSAPGADSAGPLGGLAALLAGAGLALRHRAPPDATAAPAPRAVEPWTPPLPAATVH